MINSIANILGYVIRLIYRTLNYNYFWTIIIFTILTKIILFPLYYSQMKSNREMRKVQPLYKKIMEKYKDDKMKQSEEITKLYAEHKISPAKGCLPTILQLFLVLAMFYIVKQPLTYIQKLPEEQVISYAKEYLQSEDVTFKQAKAYEINIAKEYNLMDMTGIKNINLGDVPANAFSKDESKKTSYFTLIIPLLSLILSVISNKISQKSMEMTEEQKEMQKSMNLMMPLLSASISYSMPLALGVYWTLGSVLSLIQQVITNKVLDKKYNENKDSKDTLFLKGGK